MAEKYGNLPFGQVYKLLISIIGQDAALAIADEQGIPVTREDLRRMFEEEDRSFVHFRPSEKTGAMELVRNFFRLLEEKYSFPENVGTLVIVSFFGTFRDAIRTLAPYEKQTRDIALHLLNWFLAYLLIPMENSDGQIISISKESIDSIFDDTYELIFGEVFQKLGIHKEDFYQETNKNYKGKHLKDFEQAMKRNISKCCKNDSNEPWEKDWNKFKAILDFINLKGEKELVHSLIGLYLLKNTETALKEICGIEQKDIYQIKQDLRFWAQDNLPSEPQTESQCFLMIAGKYDPSDLSLLQKDLIDHDCYEQGIAIKGCGNYLWGKNSVEPEKAKQLIQEMEENCPHCGVFFVNWAKARLAVLSCQFDDSEEDKKFQEDALEYYRLTFDKGRNFAGNFKAFLEESIAATVYLNRRRIQDIPKVIDTDESLKTPLTDDAKRYYEYGYALNLFEQESAETYFLHFHAEEHFWKVFPFHQFTHTESAELKYNEDLLKAKGIYPSYINTNNAGEVDKWVSLTKHTEKLKGVTEKTINKRMEIQPGHNVQYTPLSVALWTHQLDIAEHYLNDFADSLDVTVINTHGSTALLEALTQYKNNRYFEKDEQETERYKKIIMELIKRSPVDSLYAKTVKKIVSVLEEAINTYDIEIVRAIVEKKGFDIQNLIINADELSPLYFAVQRSFFIKGALSKGYIDIDSINGNISWKNLNVPGMFLEDKQQYVEKIKSYSLYNDKLIKILSTFENIGFSFQKHEFEKIFNSDFDDICKILIKKGINSSIWEQEFEEMKKIIKYLIDRTSNVDAFVKKAPNGDRTTVLALTIESDFDDICRLLIGNGANPARVFCKNGMPYDSPFFRSVWYKSWITLEMLLTDFKNKIEPIINERFREEKQTAAHLLFKVDYGPNIYQYSVNNENFKHIERFIPLFRSADADFDIPDNSHTTVRQILGKQYGYLVAPYELH